MRITIRLNAKKDQDIIQHLNNVKNISKEVRRLLRAGLGAAATQAAARPTVITKPQLPKSTPKHVEAEDVLSNLLGNF